MRLIDADDVIEKIKKKAKSGQWAEAVVYGMSKALYLVESAPTERKQGEWIKFECGYETHAKCSICNNTNTWGEVAFCPWCGSDMRKKEGDEKKSCLNCGSSECELGNRARYGFCGNWTIMKECDDMSAEKSNTPEFEWICPECGGKEYDANSLCLDCGSRMISREVTENECKGN